METKGTTQLKQHVNITVVGQRGVGKTLLCKRLLSWYHKNLVAPSGSEEPEYPDSDEDVNEYFDNFVLEEEKSGTIESGRSYLETKHKRVTLIDTPGHPVLQAQLLLGIAQADVALIVVSFDSPEDVVNQIKPQYQLLLGKGVHHIGIVLFVDQAQVSFAEVAETIQHSIPYEFVTQQIISYPKQVRTGDPILQFIDELEVQHSQNEKLLMPIVHVHPFGGTYLFGKIESGKIVLGQHLFCMPSRTKCIVEDIQDTRNHEVEVAYAGDNVKLKVSGEPQVKIGDVISNSDQVFVCQEILALIKVDLTNNATKLVSAGYECLLQLHTLTMDAEVIAVSEHSIDGQQQAPNRYLKSGDQRQVTFRFAQPVCLQKAEHNTKIGSFLMIKNCTVVGQGVVLKVKLIL